jgi:hypothetical protein
MQAILDQLTGLGQVALVLAELAFVGAVWLAMLWKPRHNTHRPHDCRDHGCPWLNERPK